jgi:hypothetical protein
VASTHCYPTCNQKGTDVVLFSTVPTFVSDVQYFRQQLAARMDLANVPVWVTENNVNADYAVANGMNNCNPGQEFVPDTRGTTAFLLRGVLTFSRNLAKLAARRFTTGITAPTRSIPRSITLPATNIFPTGSVSRSRRRFR